MSKKTDLNIIVLSFNSQYWLKKTLSSLKEHYLNKTKYKVEVTVVDNASEDETVKMVNQSFRWTNLIKLDENLGFAVGNNVALKRSTSRYVMLLNADTEFFEHSNLDIIIDYMDQNPRVGIATPRLEFADGQIDPACHRGEPTPWASFAYFSKLAKLFPRSKKFAQYHQTYKDLLAPHEIDACSGAAMVVRSSAIKTVGLLDERFFMYAEDLDWCRRFRDKKFKIIYLPQVRVVHHKNKSGILNTSTSIASKTKRHFYDTMMQYYDKHYQDKYPQFVRTLVRYFLEHRKGGI